MAVTAYARLGDLQWRVDPTNVQWNYQLDANRIETLGGQVVQVFGATLSDLTVMGDLGQDHARAQESWQLANAFHKKIKSMMDTQVLSPKTALGVPKGKKSGIVSDVGVVHHPLSFTYTDGLHNWNFKVLIKGIADGDGSGALTYRNAKFNHRYILTMFIVQADSDVVTAIASDAFLARISEGIGWSKTGFNGPITAQQASEFIQSNGGSVDALLQTAISGQPLLQPPGVDGPGSVGGRTLKSAR